MDKFANTTKRDKGNLFHAAMDEYYETGVVGRVKDPEVQLWADRAWSWSVAVLEPRCVEIHSEVYVGHNFSTGETLTDPKVRNRNYPDVPGMLHGTADLVCILHTGDLLIADWKSGGSSGATEQLLTLACGLREVYKDHTGAFRNVLLSVLSVGEQAAEAGVLPYEWAVSESDLLTHRDAMAFQLADIGVRNDPVPGIHCTKLYCPHLAYCPGVTGAVDDLAVKGGLVTLGVKGGNRELTTSPEDDDHAGYIASVLAAAKRQIGYYDEALRRYAEDGGRVLSGDMEWRKTNSGFRWVKR